MKYYSTRDTKRSNPLSFSEVFLKGLAEDGGLYVPESLPYFSPDEIKKMKGLSYSEIAYKIIRQFIEPSFITDGELREILDKVYSTINFQHKDIAPLIELQRNGKKFYLFELFHGHTLAFKDFAMQFLGHIMGFYAKKHGTKFLVLGATSGDTGSAAIYATRNVPGCQTVILYPADGTSEFQRKQMTTTGGENIHPIAIEGGSFDDCQKIVKEIFNIEHHNGKIKSFGYQLIAVNSINWTRIMAQTVYYFYAHLSCPHVAENNFSVPTGNLGNVYAGYLAKKMGLPIGRFTVTTNSNNVLHRFLSNNDYSKNSIIKTIAPSMDIQVSSNFERFLFDVFANDAEKVDGLMQEFAKTNKLQLDIDHWKKAKLELSSGDANDKEIIEEIRKIYEENGYIIDPHTATATMFSREDDIVLSTAHPVKFMSSMREAIDAKNLTDLDRSEQEFLSNCKEEKFTLLERDTDKVNNFINDILA